MSSYKVLVVDDSEQFRRLICRTLQTAKFDVIEASDGQESLQKAEQFQPDLILMDIGLPKLNGIEAGRRIRTLSPYSDLLFVSQESSAEVEGALPVHSRGFIHKLSVPDYLLPAIEGIRSGNHAHRHEVQLYRDDSVLMERMERFFTAALMTGGAAIVFATKPHRDALVERLKHDGVDVDGAIQAGTYVALDAAEMLSTIMVNGQPDCDRFQNGLSALIDSAAAATGRDHPRVAVFGECVALLQTEGNLEAAIRIEQTGNSLLKARVTPVVDILCAYPVLPFEMDSEFQSICREHSSFSVR